MFSWAIPGSKEFCHRLFLVFCVVSLENAANFLLLFNVAMILRQELCELWTPNWFLPCNKSVDLLYYEGKGFQQRQMVKDFKKRVQHQKATNTNINISNFVSPIYNFSMARNINFYTPIHGTNSEKYFNHIFYEGKMTTLAGNKHLAVHFFFHRLQFFHPSTEESTGLIRQKWTEIWLFPRQHNKQWHERKM